MLSLDGEMKFIRQVENIFKTNTLRHFSITSLGTAVNGALGLLFYIVVARFLGPTSYGFLAVAIAAVTMIADIADLGIDTTLLRFVSKYRHDDPKTAAMFIKLGLKYKFFVWLTILLIGWITAPQIAESIFLKPELANPLRMSLIGAGGAMLFSLSTHVVQAYEKFWVWSLLNISLNGLRVIAVGILILLSFLNPLSVLWVYIALPFAGFFVSLLFLPNFLQATKENSVSSEFLNYSKWVGIVGILGATAGRLDTFISARLLSITDVGIYSAAVHLSIVVPQVVFALAAVVAPKLSGMNTAEKAVGYLKKVQLLVTALFFAGVLVSPMAYLVIPLIYGSSYSAAVLPFLVLFLAQLVFLLSIPSHQAIYYYFSKPNIFSFVTLGQLIITAFFGWILISNFGTLGAALTVLINNLFGFIIPGIWVIYQFRKGGKVEKENNLGSYAS